MNWKDLNRTKPINRVLEEFNAGGGDAVDGHGQLKRHLTLTDLTAFGIAAIIGAGIFAGVGKASFNGGPAVSLLYIFTAIACAFSALSYAEFASRVPVAGSAYTYAYTSFGELVAWIIGWDLLLEYGIGNIAVAISWSDYFTTLLKGFNIHLPEYLTMDGLTAWRAFNAGDTASEAYAAWVNAPRIFGLPLIADFPALMIVFIITILCYIGIRESRTASNLMVLLKLGVIVMVILIGIFYVNPANWVPFAPNGFSGVMKGVAAVFFAYIGFDAISTTAEECKNPQRDLPKSMIYSLIICTVLYVLIAFVLTGMVSYTELNVGDPLAHVFSKLGMNWISGIIAFSAIIATASVLLVFQLGQPRIWMNMSRDGLLPPVFSRIHPRFGTPSFSTVVTGFLVAIPALFMNLTEVTDLTSIGTLFAFVLVNGGVLVLEGKGYAYGKFKVPYINGKFIIPVIVGSLFLGLSWFFPDVVRGFLTDSASGWDKLKHLLPYWLFMAVAIALAIQAFRHNLSLLPALGLLTCFYLMTELGWTNWMRFIIWLLIGLIIYFGYSYHNSKLRKAH
ncbi:amino acid permease [Sphingobacteriales bacterium UPWRP_1]|nr:amino acid transporter [Sphingobacteriales bacterium TSM_CSM]PSJ75236.1 amino acid permease [Sphingobacteriales bacterium UPWRP_1]